MVKLKVEMLGDVGKTEKGFIAQYLVFTDNGKKDVVKVFSKKPDLLVGSGTIEVKNDFFFAVG